MEKETLNPSSSLSFRSESPAGLLPPDLFRQVWTGWFWGMASIFGLVFLLLALATPILNPAETADVWLALLLLPIIFAGQGVMIAGVVVAGCWLYQKCIRRRASTTPDTIVGSY